MRCMLLCARCATVLAVVLVAVTASGQAPAAKTYRVDFRFLQVLEPEHILGHDPAAPGSGTAEAPTPSPNDGATVVLDAPAKVLAEPSLTVPAGMRASLRIGDTRPLQYFEPAGEGLYRLKTLDEALYVEAAVTVDETGTADRLGVKGRVVARVVTGRDRVEGTELSIGKPAVAPFELEFEETVYPGVWMLVVAPSEPGDEPLPPGMPLVALRVTVAEGE